MTAGADQTFRDVVREAIDRRDAIIRWRMQRRQRRSGDRRSRRARSASSREETLDSVEAEFFTGALIAASEWPAIAAALARGNKTDCEQAQRFTALTALSGANRIETLSGNLLHRRRQSAQIHRHQGDQGCARWSSS